MATTATKGAVIHTGPPATAAVSAYCAASDATLISGRIPVPTRHSAQAVSSKEDETNSDTPNGDQPSIGGNGLDSAQPHFPRKRVRLTAARSPLLLASSDVRFMGSAVRAVSTGFGLALS